MLRRGALTGRRAVALAVLRTGSFSLDNPSGIKEPKPPGFARPTGRRRLRGAPAQASRVSGGAAVSENESSRERYKTPVSEIKHHPPGAIPG
jgi:hypothetical protein